MHQNTGLLLFNSNICINQRMNMPLGWLKNLFQLIRLNLNLLIEIMQISRREHQEVVRSLQIMYFYKKKRWVQ